MRDDHALQAYDAFASIYDEFNSQNDYESWFAVLLAKLERLGLPGSGSLLDVACGTGMAVAPMLRRGWVVRGCDISPRMVDRARSKYPEVQFDVADMRDLPRFDEDGFDLVWALNDPMNYLLGDGELQLALESMGRNLAVDGLLVFDVNTLALFADSFNPNEGLDRGDRWQWKARGEVDGIWEAELSGDGMDTHLHRERHYPVPEVQRAMLDAGLEPVAAMGQREDENGITIEDGWDEERDLKILHVARRRQSSRATARLHSSPRRSRHSSS
jgi:SAM-dependent methyltransferase